jgi:uncharacterized protein (TIGR02453 family)
MIQPSFFNFLAKLEVNNSKQWFDQNRSDYELNVKKPFEDVVEVLGNEISKFDNEITTDYRKNIFRINRDIRFAKDKTPYKTNRSVAYSPHGKKDAGAPGYYVELGINKCYLAGGAWCPSSDHLFKIRQEIYYNSAEFNSLVNDPVFIKNLGGIQGKKAIKIPKEITEWVSSSNYMMNKEFYFIKEFDVELVFKPDFVACIAKWLRSGYEINRFFRRAMSEI